jgi:hypothetical protein
MLIARLRGLRTPKIDSAGPETGSLSLSKRPSRRKGEPDE